MYNQLLELVTICCLLSILYHSQKHRGLYWAPDQGRRQDPGHIFRQCSVRPTPSWTPCPRRMSACGTLDGTSFTAQSAYPLLICNKIALRGSSHERLIVVVSELSIVTPARTCPRLNGFDTTPEFFVSLSRKMLRFLRTLAYCPNSQFIQHKCRQSLGSYFNPLSKPFQALLSLGLFIGKVL